MYSSTHHAGTPLNHMVSSGSDKYWTYKQKNGIRRMKPFVEEYFNLAPMGKDFNVKGYLVNSDGGMVHVDKNNKLTFYKDMSAQQKKKVKEIQNLNKKLMDKPAESKEQTKPQEQTKPKVDPNDFYQRLFFPKKYNFKSWNPAVKKYFIERNKNIGHFCFQDIKQDIKKDMPEGAVEWFEKRKKHLLEMQKKTHGVHAQPQRLKKKTSAVSTNLDIEEISKLKKHVESIEIVSVLHKIITTLEHSDTKWPTEKPKKLEDLLGYFFSQYNERSLLFQDRTDNLKIRDKLKSFQNIYENPNQDFGDNEVLKAFSCYIRELPHSFDEIKTMDSAVVSMMTKHLLQALKQLKSELFNILLAHEKQKKQKKKEENRMHGAAACLGLSRDASVEQVETVAVKRLNSSDVGKIPKPALYFALKQLFMEIPPKSSDKYSFDLTNLTILSFILINHPNMPKSFFEECFTVTPQCNECLNVIKNEVRKMFVVQQTGDFLNPAGL